MRAIWVLFASGCVLFSKSEPVEQRYFSPEPVAGGSEHAEHACDARLRLGHIAASDYLDTRIAHRESSVELELYDTRRWTERPDDYVRRSLAHQLFDVRGLAESKSRRDPTLAVEVIGFEEVHHEGRHAGRVQLTFQLGDESVVARGEVTKEVEVTGTGFGPVVAAISAAMTAATSEVAHRTADALCAMPAPALREGGETTRR